MQYIGIFMNYLFIKFHMPDSNNSSAVVKRLAAKEKFHISTILSHTIQKYYSTKR